MPEITRQAILRKLDGLSPAARVDTLHRILAEARAAHNASRFPTPGNLAQHLDSRTVQTPALDIIDRAIVDTITTGGRLAISLPPQEGKSTRVAVYTPLWALMRDRDTRVVVASYADSLARRNAMAARGFVQRFGTGATDDITGRPMPDELGYGLADDHRRANSWAVRGYDGGYYATGTGGALTGRAADLFIVDDPFKNQVQADSAREREKVWEWWTAVAQTRLAPGAAVIIINTRWHIDDLVGRIFEQDQQLPTTERLWNFINIPAIAEKGVPDALHRDPGQPLVSARGRTLTDFRTIQQAVGPRVWAALYQGLPTPSEGGLFAQDDFDAHRVESTNLCASHPCSSHTCPSDI